MQPLVRLDQTLRLRAVERPSGSYTTKLIEGGVPAIAAKIREEAEELIEAAGQSENHAAGLSRQHTVGEAADLLYHALVLLAHRGISLAEVATELARREGTSGLVEKASRGQNPADPA